ATSVVLMKRIVFTALVAATAFGLVGCSAGGFSSFEPTSGQPAPDMAPSFQDADRGTTESSAGGDTSSNSAQQVITHGSLRVTVADPVFSADEVSRIVTAAGGHVESRNEFVGTPGTPGRADLTVRIPANRLDPTLDSIK